MQNVETQKMLRYRNMIDSCVKSRGTACAGLEYSTLMNRISFDQTAFDSIATLKESARRRGGGVNRICTARQTGCRSRWC